MGKKMKKRIEKKSPSRNLRNLKKKKSRMHTPARTILRSNFASMVQGPESKQLLTMTTTMTRVDHRQTKRTPVCDSAGPATKGPHNFEHLRLPVQTSRMSSLKTKVHCSREPTRQISKELSMPSNSAFKTAAARPWKRPLGITLAFQEKIIVLKLTSADTKA